MTEVIVTQVAWALDELDGSDFSAVRLHSATLRDTLTAYQGRVERLEGALRPFAHYYDINDCDQRHGNIEVPIEDLRRARSALTPNATEEGR